MAELNSQCNQQDDQSDTLSVLSARIDLDDLVGLVGPEGPDMPVVPADVGNFNRSHQVVSDSIAAVAYQKGFLTQRPQQIGQETGIGQNFKQCKRFTGEPGQYTSIKQADINNGINLFCSCLVCGSIQTPKGFIVQIGFEQRCLNIPKLIKKAQCPQCKGTPNSGQTFIVTMAFYNCKWFIQGQIKGSDKQFKIAQRTPCYDVTYLLPETAEKVDFDWIQIWCTSLK